MTVLVDSGVFVAHVNRRDPGHAAARRTMAAVLADRWGRAFASDYILDESVTLARSRTRSHAVAVSVADLILGRRGFTPFFDLLMVTGPIFRRALELFEAYDDQELSFTDATTVALMERRRIDHVLSFDDDFDGIVPRIEPGQEEVDAGN